MDDLSDLDAALGGPSSPVAASPSISGSGLTLGFMPNNASPPAAPPSMATSAAPTQKDDLSDLDQAINTTSAPIPPTSVETQLSQMPAWQSDLLAATRGIGNAIPFYQDIGAGAETAASYLPQAVRQYIPAVSDQNPSEPLSQRYSDYLQQQRSIDTGLAKQNPVPYYGGEIGGALGLPVGGAEALSSRIGSVLPNAASVLARPLATGAVGAGYGALYGAGSGATLSDRLHNAETGSIIGGIGGALAPAVAGGLNNIAGAVAKPFTNFLSPEAAATNRISGALSADAAAGQLGMSPQDLAAAQMANQPAALADIGGETTRALARSAANMSPEARASISGVTNDRFATQNTRFSDYMRGLFGSDLNSQSIRDELQEQGKAINGPAYQAAYNAPGANGIWNDDLSSLTASPYMRDAMQTANTKAANDAAINRTKAIPNPFVSQSDGSLSLATNPDGSTAYPTLKYWDKVKQALDGKIGVAKRAGDGDSVRELTGLKNALLNQLDKAVPQYATARQGAFKVFGAENALEAGENFLSLTKSADVSAVKKSILQMTPTQKALFARGLASQIAQKAENASERRNIIGLFNSPATMEKLKIGLGKDKAEQVATYLRRESMMDMLRSALGNSTTLRQASEAGMAAGHEGHGLTGIITSALSSPIAGAGVGAAEAYREHGFDPEEIGKYAVAGAMAGAVGKFVKTSNQKVAANIARMLASDDPKLINQAVLSISKDPEMSRALMRAESSMAALSGRAGSTAEPQPAQPSQQSLLPARARGGRIIAAQPTEGQKVAGNYQKGHVRFHGLDISIENPKGSIREGVGAFGKRWSVKMPHHYGYIRGTVGADGDHVDCYLGPDENSDKAFVIDQKDARTGKFDEHKVMLGFKTRFAANEAYRAGFSDGKGRERFDKITEMTIPELKTWLSSDATRDATAA